jgi:hypothetical protein
MKFSRWCYIQNICQDHQAQPTPDFTNNFITLQQASTPQLVYSSRRDTKNMNELQKLNAVNWKSPNFTLKIHFKKYVNYTRVKISYTKA